MRERVWGLCLHLCMASKGELVVLCGSTRTYYLS
jgi:hypothetical protein